MKLKVIGYHANIDLKIIKILIRVNCLNKFEIVQNRKKEIKKSLRDKNTLPQPHKHVSYENCTIVAFHVPYRSSRGRFMYATYDAYLLRKQ